MAQVGRYFGGGQFCIIGPSGTRITSTVPASQQYTYTYPARPGDGFPETVDTSWHHGAKLLTDWGDEYVAGIFPAMFGPSDQPYDGRPDLSLGGGGPIPYAHADNANPGALGSALLITSPGTYIQALSIPGAEISGRRYLKRRDVLHFIDHTPATNALPPPIGAVPLVSRYTKADIDLTSFPSHTPAAGAPSASALLARIRWHSNIEATRRPNWDYYVGYDYEPSYASDQAQLYADVALALCSDIDATTKELLAAHVIIHAQNTVQCLNAGARYNYPGGLGGILAGRKLFVVLAYIMTGDAWLGAWASRTDWAAEDTQVRHVSAQDVIDYDYIPADEGMADWNDNWDKTTARIARAVPGIKSYLGMFARHHVGQTLACMMVGGGKAAWNNDAFFDLADRFMERTLYDGSGTYQYYRSISGSNSPSPYHRAMWSDYRTDAGMPAVWNWS